jgi:chromosome segregation ATPase
MKKNRRSRRFLLVAAVLLLASPAIAIQGRPGGAQGGQGGQGRQQPKTGQQKGQMPSGRGAADRQRIRATDQQRDQLRDCTQTADRIRQQARDMDQLTRSKTFDAAKARQQRDQMREQFRTMEQEHQRLVNGMSQDQRNALRNQVEQMNQIRQRVNNQFGQLDMELARTDPNAKEVRERAQQISKEMNRWKSQYRSMESEMGVQP